MSQYWSNLVSRLQPYTPGEQPQVDGLIKLNTNENPYGPSPLVLKALRDTANADLRKYPDPNAQQLKDALAQYHNLQSNQVFVGNSSDEVLAHAFRALLKHDQPLLFPDLTYSFYPVYCRLFDINYTQIPLAPDFSIRVEDYSQDAGGIIFANPNAPTGILLSLDKISWLAEQHPNTVIVVDEAYVDFAGTSAVSLINQLPNLLVCQTYSKSRCLAGLRVGMAFGQAHLIEGLERVKNSFHPYALGQLAIAGAVASLSDQAYFADCLVNINKTRATTTKALISLGFEVLPSQANFVLAQHPSHSGADLFAYLRANKIIVRHFDHPRIKNYLRISIGTEAQMQTLIRTLQKRCQA